VRNHRLYRNKKTEPLDCSHHGDFPTGPNRLGNWMGAKPENALRIRRQALPIALGNAGDPEFQVRKRHGDSIWRKRTNSTPARFTVGAIPITAKKGGRGLGTPREKQSISSKKSGRTNPRGHSLLPAPLLPGERNSLSQKNSKTHSNTRRRKTSWEEI